MPRFGGSSIPCVKYHFPLKFIALCHTPYSASENLVSCRPGYGPASAAHTFCPGIRACNCKTPASLSPSARLPCLPSSRPSSSSPLFLSLCREQVIVPRPDHPRLLFAFNAWASVQIPLSFQSHKQKNSGAAPLSRVPGSAISFPAKGRDLVKAPRVDPRARSGRLEGKPTVVQVCPGPEWLPQSRIRPLLAHANLAVRATAPPVASWWQPMY